MNREEARAAFYLLASNAILVGLLTAEQRDIISRRETRKQGNWQRHLCNLREYLEWKRKGPVDRVVQRKLGI